MKKLLALLLALAMLLSFAACSEEADDSDRKRRKTRTEDTEDTTEDIGDGEEIDITENREEAEEDEEQSQKNPSQGKIENSPYTVYEELDIDVSESDDYAITIGELKDTGYWLEAPVEVENFSDGEISVSAVGAAVNGKTELLTIFASAEAGSSSTDSFYFYDYDDPSDVTRLSLLISITDEDYNTEYCLVDIYPQGEDAYEEKMPKAKGKDVLVDEDDVFAAIQSYTNTDDSFSFDYLMINNSQETVRICMDPTAYNGFGISDYLSEVLLPGTYTEETAGSYEYEYLAKLGIGDITSLTLDVELQDVEYKALMQDTVTVYPKGKDQAEPFKYQTDSDDLVLAKGDDFTLYVVLVEEDDVLGTQIYFVLENKGGGFLSVDGSEIKINGKEMEGGWLYCSIYDGRDTFDRLTIYDFEKEDLNITQVTSVEMLLTVKNDSYKTVFEDTVKFEITW